MKNRWIALYVENEVGVLAKVAGLFSGKCYNEIKIYILQIFKHYKITIKGEVK